jgi:hypothetical protein
MGKLIKKLKTFVEPVLHAVNPALVYSSPQMAEN